MSSELSRWAATRAVAWFGRFGRFFRFIYFLPFRHRTPLGKDEMRKPWTKRQDAADAHRLRGRAGQERRRRWLSTHPLCKHCLGRGRITAGTTVDHVQPLSAGGRDDETNLQSLCAECDRVKTAKDRGHRLRPRIDASGWPVSDEQGRASSAKEG